MAQILLKAGWLGRNGLAWYSAPDGLGEPVLALIAALNENGHEAVLYGDLSGKISPDIEIHLDRQLPYSRSSYKILISLEPYFVQPQNKYFPIKHYNVIFNARTDIEEDEKNFHYLYPRSLEELDVPGYDSRDILISCIAGNKNAVLNSKYNLYPTRQRFIRNLDERLGKRFHLYGSGWEMSDHRVGFLSKILMRTKPLNYLFRRPVKLDSYRGICKAKSSVMSRSLFTLCIENNSAPGSITEKIFDCFQHGSVPLYLGPPDIESLIPKRLFVDLNDFETVDDLIRFMNLYSYSDFEAWDKERRRLIPRIAHERSLSQFTSRIISKIPRDFSLK